MTFPVILERATVRELELAVAYNHKELFRQESIALGGQIITIGGLSWTTGTAESTSMIAFPDLEAPDPSSSDPDTPRGSNPFDELISFYLHHPPRGAGCWSLDPARPPDLGVLLLARGFQPGWRPHWMGIDLAEIRPDHPSPRGLVIHADKDSQLTAVNQLPYARVVIPLCSCAAFPGQWMRFVAYLHGKVVGQSVVFMTVGEWGVAGIYHVGVVPRARGKGVGKAVTLAACLYAREKGYRYAVLNSTEAGKGTYEGLGFTTVGDGWTWWLTMERLLAHPPERAEIRLAEAIGRNDRADLGLVQSFYTPADLDRPMANGMTLMQLAVHLRQPMAAEWLVEHGGHYSVLDAWDLGWKDRAAQLLRLTPKQADRLYGDGERTLMHIAAERNDGELAELGLSAHPNLRLKDKNYKATPLEWAKHFGHRDIARLIQEQERKG